MPWCWVLSTCIFICRKHHCHHAQKAPKEKNRMPKHMLPNPLKRKSLLISSWCCSCRLVGPAVSGIFKHASPVLKNKSFAAVDVPLLLFNLPLLLPPQSLQCCCWCCCSTSCCFLQQCPPVLRLVTPCAVPKRRAAGSKPLTNARRWRGGWARAISFRGQSPTQGSQALNLSKCLSQRIWKNMHMAFSSPLKARALSNTMCWCGRTACCLPWSKSWKLQEGQVHCPMVDHKGTEVCWSAWSWRFQSIRWMAVRTNSRIYPHANALWGSICTSH